MISFSKYICWFLFVHNIIIFNYHFIYSSQVSNISLNECLPQLADKCFNKLSTSLNCHQECDDPEVFCELLDDSLQCSADIIDGDCSKTNNGTTKFDSWFKGLRAVYSYMCLPVSTNGTQKSRIPYFSNTECWNKRTFVKCVGEMLNIHHVADMFNTMYDYKECIRMIISMITCNMNSLSTSCDGYHEAFVNDLVFIFFSQHKCNEFETNRNGASFLSSPNCTFISAIIIIYFFIVK